MNKHTAVGPWLPGSQLTEWSLSESSLARTNSQHYFVGLSLKTQANSMRAVSNAIAVNEELVRAGGERLAR